MKNVLGVPLTQDPNISLFVYAVDAEGWGEMLSLPPQVTDERGQKKYVFSFDSFFPKEKRGEVREVSLLSRASRPCDVEGPFVDDRRKLGVLVFEIKLSLRDGTELNLESWLTNDSLAGWHGVETLSMRWTNGRGLIPFPSEKFKDCESVSILLGAQPFYVLEPASKP